MPVFYMSRKLEQRSSILNSNLGGFLKDLNQASRGETITCKKKNTWTGITADWTVQEKN